MDIIYYVHKSVELLFQILELVEVWTRRSMELLPLGDEAYPSLDLRLPSLDDHQPSALWG
jgi:hypothetical protein